MGIIDKVRLFYYKAKAAKCLGRGEKYFRKKDFERALEYYKLSLRYEALATEDKLNYVAAKYCIARTYYELNDDDQALSYARSSYDSMKLLAGSSPFLDRKLSELKSLIDHLKK